MKKLFAIVLALVLTCAVAFAAEGTITVMSREDGSGTRGAFVELTGVEQDDVDMTTVDAVITNSTAVMLTSVAGDPAAIGYVSMGSLNETVKAVSVDGNAATVEGIKDGSYTLARPFVVTTFGEVGEIAQDFLNYIMSAEGQAVINEEWLHRHRRRRRGLHRRWRVRRDHRGRLLFRDPRHGEAGRGLHGPQPRRDRGRAAV